MTTLPRSVKPDLASLQARLDEVRARLARAAARSGRDPAEVTLIAVTKTVPPATIRAAIGLGLSDLGENRVQEAELKIGELGRAGLRWHLIGHLQRNKARAAAGRFALIHSLDSIRLADALEAAAAAKDLTQEVLVQVNVAKEPQKDGALPQDAEALVRHVADLPHLALQGLMTIAPFTDDAVVIRRTFRGLRELRDSIRESRLTVLSMGMSHDFEIAVEEGATLLRLGTVLFGERTP